MENMNQQRNEEISELLNEYKLHISDITTQLIHLRAYVKRLEKMLDKSNTKVEHSNNLE